MKITLCGSLKFYKEMRKIEDYLSKNGHEVLLPVEIEDINYNKKTPEQGISNIINGDLIRKHYKKILQFDAVLIINFDKNNINNYIGGNTFLEAGFAHVNNKKLFILNEIPRELNYYEELMGMEPNIINGDLSKI